MLSAVAVLCAIRVGDACLADGQGVLVQAVGNRLTVGAGDDSPGGQQIGQRVFGQALPASGVDRDPSFFSLATPPEGLDALPAGAAVSWDFLPLTIKGVASNLFHWDGNGSVDFAPAAGQKLSLFDVTNAMPATVEGTAEAIPGNRLGTVTNDALSLHAHRFWALQGEGGDPLLGGGDAPAPGVYLTSLRLRVDGFVPSEPFFVAVATPGTPALALSNEALPWIEANIDDLILRGDYNFDGLLNAADFELWRAQFGATTAQAVDVGEADGNRDGVVDAADYTVWRDSLMAASGAAESLPAPEPGSAAIVVGVLAAFAHRRRSRDW